MKNILVFILSVFFISCSNKSKKTTNIEFPDFAKIKSHEKIGDSAIKFAFMSFSSNLSKSIKKNGLENSIDFCGNFVKEFNENSKNNIVKITRISEKNRNPKNTPNSFEQNIINDYKSKMASKENITPLFNDENTEYSHFVKPIFISNPVCLNCHGTPNKEVSLKVHKKILEKYPNDKAIGYNIGDFRGIWHVYIKK